MPEENRVVEPIVLVIVLPPEVMVERTALVAMGINPPAPPPPPVAVRAEVAARPEPDAPAVEATARD